MNPFASLGLSPALVRAAGELGYAQPTPIQAAAIPAVLAGRDVLGSAETGSGKTAAFALPLLQQLECLARQSPRRTHALVLVPTRELAAQVGESIRALARHLADPVKVAVLFGGVSINPQMMALRGGAARHAGVQLPLRQQSLHLVDHRLRIAREVAQRGHADQAAAPARDQTRRSSSDGVPCISASTPGLWRRGGRTASLEMTERDATLREVVG